MKDVTISGPARLACIYRSDKTTAIGSTGNLSYTDTTGTAGTLYIYSVTAVDQVGHESAQSNFVTVTYPGKTTGGGKNGSGR